MGHRVGVRSLDGRGLCGIYHQFRTVRTEPHRMRTVLGADHIVVLDGGTVSEQGMPKELIAKGGEFAQMVKLQQENNNEK